MAGKVTIRDLAREAGVSLSTVSGVLNGVAEFSEPTKKKVWAVANAMGYVPNTQARRLRAGDAEGARRKTGVIIHISHLGDETPLGNAFEAERSLLLAWEAEKYGMYPISYWYRHLKGFQCPPVLNGTVDGAIVGTPHPEVVEALRGKLPMVLMDVPFSPQMADVPMVNTDWNHGVAQLLAHLRGLGHRRIGVISAADPGEGIFGEADMLGKIVAAARANGIEIHPECQRQVEITPETHERVMDEVSPHYAAHVRTGGISAIVCPNCAYASSFLRAFRPLGLRVPEDVSLATTNYYPQPSAPLICSASNDWPGLVKTSLETLRKSIDGKPLYCQEFLVRPNFHPGSTVGAAR